MSVVYIAGKMAGLPDMGKQHFHAAAARLREEGHIVLNPAELPDGMPVDRYMPLCLAMIGAADTVYALDNWSCSMGAIIEVNYARYQGKTIINEAVCKANEPVNETYRLDGQVKKPYTPAEIRVIHAGEMTDRDKAFRSSILGRMEDDQEITKTEKALQLVAKERNRQIAMWGDGNENHPFEWMSILGEEFGELCEAANETCFVHPQHPELGGSEAIVKEAVQVAAVAVAIAEAFIAQERKLI